MYHWCAKKHVVSVIAISVVRLYEEWNEKNLGTGERWASFLLDYQKGTRGLRQTGNYIHFFCLSHCSHYSHSLCAWTYDTDLSTAYERDNSFWGSSSCLNRWGYHFCFKPQPPKTKFIRQENRGDQLYSISNVYGEGQPRWISCQWTHTPNLPFHITIRPTTPASHYRLNRFLFNQ